MLKPSVNVVIDASQDGIPGACGAPAFHGLACLVGRNNAEGWLRPELAALPQDVAVMQAQLIQ